MWRSSLILEGGVTRQIHVSRQRIVQRNGRCIIIEDPDGRLFASGVTIDGPSSVRYSPKKIEGGANVWVETDAPLIVQEAEPAK